MSAQTFSPTLQHSESNLCPHLLGTLAMSLTDLVSLPPLTPREYKRVGSYVKCHVGTTQLSRIELIKIYN